MRDQPLQCRVEGDELVIRIGLDCLKMAAEYCPRFYNYEVHKGSVGPYETVEDINELASDIRCALTHEEEDGSSPLTELFDDAILAAAENGSIGFEDKVRPSLQG
jgi:hypothetical protein